MNEIILDYIEPYGIIYEIKNLINEKRYIGQTILKLNKRCNWTEDSIKRNYKWNPHLINSVNMYNFDNFERKIIDFGYNQEDLDKKEEFYIQKYNTLNPIFGYNFRHGGSHGEFSEESKKKISEALKGEKHPMYGKHPSEETRKKMSEIKKRYYKENPNAMKGENNPNYGKKRSEETKKKIGEKRKGKSYEDIVGTKKAKEWKEKISETQKKRLNKKTGGITHKSFLHL